MSGIAGVWHFDGRPVDRQRLGRMTDTLSHRGPDDRGLWTGESVGLGHRMLEVTPESSAETQPHTLRGGQLSITADARIDNRDDLIEALRLDQRLPSPVTDVEIILRAYEKWGRACPEHLIGAYAFVIWDRPEQRLFCARDHLGIKPLFYYSGSDRFVAASELKAIFVQPTVPRRINEARVAEHLVVAPNDVESTFYEEIVHVPPAHTLTVTPRGVRKRRYWTLDLERELHLGSDEAYAKALREQFLEAVECRLRTTSPIGSTLSGGLDSSSVACAARDLTAETGTPLHTFSLVFPSFSGEQKDEIDERDFMDEVLATGGFEPHFIRGDEHSPLEFLDEMLSHVDHAFWAPNQHLHWLMYSAAEENGVRVLLDGLDGDGTISRGLQYPAELATDGAWDAFDEHVTALAERYDKPRGNLARRHAYPVLRALVSTRPIQFFRRALSVSSRFDIPLREIASGIWLREAVPSWIARWVRGNTEERSTAAVTERPLIRRDLAQKFDLTEKDLRTDECEEALRTHREAHVSPFLGNAYPRALSIMDKTSAAFGIEARYPFFDRRLIELSVSLPATTKLQDGWPRYIFRRAMDGILPEAVQWRRRKARLGANFVQTLAQDDASTMKGLLRKNESLLADFVDPERMRDAISTLDTDASGIPLTLYTLATLAAWLEREHVRTEKTGRT